MERGLLVELSPNEETALQRIAQGMMLTADMEPHHLARLKQLALIEERGTDFRLTDLGRQRLAIRRAAPRTSPGDKPVPEPDSLGG
jgi:predicted transcriptional regulator